jgi:Ca2+/Na+ antiporter
MYRRKMTRENSVEIVFVIIALSTTFFIVSCNIALLRHIYCLMLTLLLYKILFNFLLQKEKKKKIIPQTTKFKKKNQRKFTKSHKYTIPSEPPAAIMLPVASKQQ